MSKKLNVHAAGRMESDTRSGVFTHNRDTKPDVKHIQTGGKEPSKVLRYGKSKGSTLETLVDKK